MNKILIFGSGSQARVIFSELTQIKKYKILGFVDEKIKKGIVIENKNKKKFKVVGDINNIKHLITNNTFGIIGIGSNFKREKIFKYVSKKYKKLKWATLISKNSIISQNVTVGSGSVIISGTIINTGTKIGKHCIVNTSSSIDHDNLIKDFSSVGPGVTTGGNVTLGENSHIGIGSTVNNEITIGTNTVIGAMSLVVKNCNKNSLYYGTPVKRIKKRLKDDKYL